jgi:xylan 1,4-beta-xylosidase
MPLDRISPSPFRRLPAPPSEVSVELRGLPAAMPLRLEHYRIDATHSNAFTAWKAMGSPAKPDAEQYAALERESRLPRLDAPSTATPGDGSLTLRFSLPRQGVSLLVLTPNLFKP